MKASIPMLRGPGTPSSTRRTGRCDTSSRTDPVLAVDFSDDAARHLTGGRTASSRRGNVASARSYMVPRRLRMRRVCFRGWRSADADG